MDRSDKELKFHPIRVFIAPGQEKKIRTAVQKKTGLSINVYGQKHSTTKGRILNLTDRQISVLKKEFGVYKLRMTPKQVEHNARYKGGFIGMIIASCIAAAASAAITGAIENEMRGGSITTVKEKPAICNKKGNGILIYRKGKKLVRVEKQGKGLFLRPFRSQRYPEGDGLFLRQRIGRGIHHKPVKYRGGFLSWIAKKHEDNEKKGIKKIFPPN